MTSMLLGLQGLSEGVVYPFTIWVFAALPHGYLSHLWGALAREVDTAWLCQLRTSTHKWSHSSMEFIVWILKTLLGQSFIPLLALPLFSSINSVVEVVVKLILWSEPLHILTVRGKVFLFTLFNKSRPVFFCQIFVLTEGGVLVPPNLHKLMLIAHLSLRDDLHSYLLPLLLHLLRILNICLNRVFEEFIRFIFGQLIKSLQG
jgi:hypothetical protein